MRAGRGISWGVFGRKGVSSGLDNFHKRNLNQWFLILLHNRIIWELLKNCNAQAQARDSVQQAWTKGFFLTKVFLGAIPRRFRDVTRVENTGKGPCVLHNKSKPFLSAGNPQVWAGQAAVRGGGDLFLHLLIYQIRPLWSSKT